MRDGVHLSADVYLPRGAGATPRLARPHRLDPHPLQQRLEREHPQGPRPGRLRLRLRDPGRARTLGFRRSLVALRRRARGRLRHPGLDRRTALEQRPHRHVRSFLPGFGPVAQRAPGASKPRLLWRRSPSAWTTSPASFAPVAPSSLVCSSTGACAWPGVPPSPLTSRTGPKFAACFRWKTSRASPDAIWTFGVTGCTCRPRTPTGPPSTPARTGTTSPSRPSSWAAGTTSTPRRPSISSTACACTADRPPRGNPGSSWVPGPTTWAAISRPPRVPATSTSAPLPWST